MALDPAGSGVQAAPAALRAELVDLPMEDVAPFRELVLGRAEGRELLVRQLGGGEASRLDEVDPVVQPVAAPRDLSLLALEACQERAELGVGERRDIADVGE